MDLSLIEYQGADLNCRPLTSGYVSHAVKFIINLSTNPFSPIRGFKFFFSFCSGLFIVKYFSINYYPRPKF